MYLTDILSAGVGFCFVGVQRGAGDDGFYVITDVNPESITRLVLCLPHLLDLENERVYLKGKYSDLPSLKEANPHLLRLIHDFADNSNCVHK